MAVIMLGCMLSMYRNTRINVGIAVGAVVVFAGSLWLVRSQETVQDESWMRAMIPHHSIAILTSERAEIDHLRVCSAGATLLVSVQLSGLGTSSGCGPIWTVSAERWDRSTIDHRSLGSIGWIRRVVP